jgi:outer membrane receptor for ferric coprogen and ferric-rhodotorulic acid
MTQFQWTELSPGDSRASVVLTGTPAVTSTEYGVKGYLLGRRLFFSLAYYKLERSDTFGSLTRVNTESPIGSGQLVVAREHFVTDGDVADGWELEVIGNLTKRITVSGAIGIGDTFRPVPTPQNPDAGRALPFVPDWDANIFFKYNLRNAQREGFEFTAGANFLGPIQAYNVGSNLGEAGFMPIDRTQHIFNAGVSYAWNKGRYTVHIRGTNLTDDTYIIVRVNEPRTVRAAFTMEF